MSYAFNCLQVLVEAPASPGVSLLVVTGGHFRGCCAKVINPIVPACKGYNKQTKIEGVAAPTGNGSSGCLCCLQQPHAFDFIRYEWASREGHVELCLPCFSALPAQLLLLVATAAHLGSHLQGQAEHR